MIVVQRGFDVAVDVACAEVAEVYEEVLRGIRFTGGNGQPVGDWGRRRGVSLVMTY